VTRVRKAKGSPISRAGWEIETVRAKVASLCALKEWTYRRIAFELGEVQASSVWRFVQGRDVNAQTFLALRSWIESLERAMNSRGGRWLKPFKLYEGRTFEAPSHFVDCPNASGHSRKNAPGHSRRGRR